MATTLTREEVWVVVVGAITGVMKCPRDKVTPTASLEKDLKVTSIRGQKIKARLEEELEIPEIPDQEAQETFKTPKDILDRVMVEVDKLAVAA